MDLSNITTPPPFTPTTLNPNITLNSTGPTTPNLLTLTYVGILICIITFALLGNLVVIIVFLCDRKLRVSSSYYIFSLAVSDVITAALVILFLLVRGKVRELIGWGKFWLNILFLIIWLVSNKITQAEHKYVNTPPPRTHTTNYCSSFAPSTQWSNTFTQWFEFKKQLCICNL